MIIFIIWSLENPTNLSTLVNFNFDWLVFSSHEPWKNTLWRQISLWLIFLWFDPQMVWWFLLNLESTSVPKQQQNIHLLVFPGSWSFPWSTDLALYPRSSHGPWPQLSALVPNLYLSNLAFNLYLPALAPNLYISVLAYNFITSREHEFFIYWPCFLNLCLYLRPWTTICITSLVPEFEFTLLLVVAAVK